MIYTFKSKAAADLILLGPNGNRVMEIVGRPPSVKGIFEVSEMPTLIAALERAVQAESSERAPGELDEERNASAVALRARVWPLVEMLRRAHAAREPIVWGV